MQRRYMLPVNALLHTLRDQQSITALAACLPGVPGLPQEAGQVVLILGQGRIQTCTIRSRDGLQLLQGAAALKALEQLGSLHWSVQGVAGSGEVHPIQSRPGAAPTWSQEDGSAEPVPRRRVAALSPEQQQALSRRHRQVFALVDGVRSVASIAALLHLSAEEVARLLHDLHHEQLID